LSCTLYASLPIFQDAYKSLVEERRLRASVIDSVAVLGALAAHYYTLMAFSSALYFAGKKLLSKTEDRSRKKLVSIFEQQPRSVWLWRDGVEVQVPFETVQSGNVLVVNAGEVIPADGLIVEGLASIDQRRLTGESQPAEKGLGEPVFAATIVLAGRILIQVERAGTETVAAQIGDILTRTADYRTAIEARSQQLADSSVLPTLGIGSLALLVRGLVGGVAAVSANFSEVLRVASPLGMLSYLSVATQNGILIKDGRSLELLRQVDTVVFDKTGTLTLERPQLGQIHGCNSLTEAELLTYAAAAEHRQTHPIARAILQAAQERGLELPAIDHASYEAGYGLRVQLGSQRVCVGSDRFMALEQIAIPGDLKTIQETAHELGYSLVYVAVNERLAGALELRPTIRPEAVTVIRQLKERGIRLYIISGDHEQPTRNLAAQLGIDRYFAEVLPEEKAGLVEQLQQAGRFICFVGDGINDAIALKKAQVSISIRGASTIATDTAQIVLMDGGLSHLSYLFQLAQDLSANLERTLALTVGPGLVCIGGVFFLHFGILSSVLLFNLSLGAGVTNAMLPMLQRQPQDSRKPA
jgi:Cu2+-exporting ATPase